LNGPSPVDSRDTPQCKQGLSTRRAPVCDCLRLSGHPYAAAPDLGGLPFVTHGGDLEPPPSLAFVGSLGLGREFLEAALSRIACPEPRQGASAAMQSFMLARSHESA
jgi:hypothetical protein